MKRRLSNRGLRALASLILVLALSVGTAAPARAGFLDWLFGGKDAVEAAAPTEVPPASGPSLTAAPAPSPTATPTATPEPTPEPTATPIPAAVIEDDGMLRVCLMSLGNPSQMALTFAGVYAVDGDPDFRFERNAKVLLSAAEGRVYLSAGGLTLNLGESVTFTRHAASKGAENGIYIAGSEKGNLYCGDLTVTAGPVGLEPVLKLHVEDYLYGVVAYEMSDSFPIEALKAQAVAARTYAMQRKWDAGDRPYDLVDTTADQVYKGYDPQYANVVAAVDATRGVVGVVGEGFARCYYTASNGGQTALPSQLWEDAEGDAYLAVTDDPYDLENPRSLKNELTITPRCGGSEALKALLEEALSVPLTFMGYAADEWRLDAIAAIAPANPVARGSRWFRELDFAVYVEVLAPSASTPAPTAAPQSTQSAAPAAPTGEPEPEPVWTRLARPVTVTLDVYRQIKDVLKLGLNRSDCELVSVDTALDDEGAPTSFTISMRRFGHGVGMSQRGAQWMAGHYDMDYGEILAFYYPGVSFQRILWPEVALTDLAALPAGVGRSGAAPAPSPTPAPLPEPGMGETVARVVLENADSTLNVRESPSLNARVLATLTGGRRVLVSGEPDEEGWVAVRTAEFSGYVKAEYLEAAGVSGR